MILPWNIYIQSLYEYDDFENVSNKAKKDIYIQKNKKLLIFSRRHLGKALTKDAYSVNACKSKHAELGLHFTANGIIIVFHYKDINQILTRIFVFHYKDIKNFRAI